ncbi:MEKHLA domain-containing protein [Paenibacillus pinihumi]|uniref:MEKHLA domain-containing protein n=1 Tax=Paenibacillus pinihumi TaxID=669462 RepID=UPI000426671B|nr:MEKHLA domain-containing protein [Paenibacillus pinihumi]
MTAFNQADAAEEAHAKLLTDCYRKWTGKELIPLVPGQSIKTQLDNSPGIILSHGLQSDPVLNYGNKTAMRLWEMEWEQFTSTPSRLTAEPMEREERAQFLAQVTEHGYVSDYTGIRISSSGRRFYIKKATVWNLVDDAGVHCGQAAAFTEYEYI